MFRCYSSSSSFEETQHQQQEEEEEMWQQHQQQQEEEEASWRASVGIREYHWDSDQEEWLCASAPSREE